MAGAEYLFHDGQRAQVLLLGLGSVAVRQQQVTEFVVDDGHVRVVGAMRLRGDR